MPVKLTDEQNNERLELYRQGMTDQKIGDTLGLSRNGVFTWRTSHGLPANNRNGRGKHKEYKSGVPMGKVLPPDGCRLVIAFFRDLVVIAGQIGEKENMDISRFIRRWREIKGVVLSK